jgi:hypothetical protein
LIASELSPAKVSDMLDRLYTKFDHLSSIHAIFKVLPRIPLPSKERTTQSCNLKARARMSP